ncbi:NAD-dependent protein deacylase [uncultured Eubacterium sp.]|uniref:NAD-dependent protein deacylase n=1 Tax=uncultured Eubacterium sp. TaxID=165185 RepID=UPI0015B2081E|nr:NAD-dependent protein deacylase [uncultured Eubacterium sp.]
MTGTEQLKQWIEASDNIVFFGGAGVSTESGIPDFRSVDGLYHQKYDYPPETILSHTFYMEKTEEFYKFYRDKMLALDAKPNAAHLKLAELEEKGKLKAVVTQNIDGLHQAAGSKNVLELHGSVHRNYCRKCGKLYDAHYIKESTGVPMCACGGQIKPDVVLYEEGLDSVTMQAAIHFISEAEILIIGGTSLAVYPAAGLIDFYRGNKLVLINKSATPMDGRADLVIQAPIGEVFSQID